MAAMLKLLVAVSLVFSGGSAAFAQKSALSVPVKNTLVENAFLFANRENPNAFGVEPLRAFLLLRFEYAGHYREAKRDAFGHELPPTPAELRAGSLNEFGLAFKEAKTTGDRRLIEMAEKIRLDVNDFRAAWLRALAEGDVPAEADLMAPGSLPPVLENAYITLRENFQHFILSLDQMGLESRRRRNEWYVEKLFSYNLQHRSLKN
jgi:hypothetical protein